MDQGLNCINSNTLGDRILMPQSWQPFDLAKEGGSFVTGDLFNFVKTGFFLSSWENCQWNLIQEETSATYEKVEKPIKDCLILWIGYKQLDWKEWLYLCSSLYIVMCTVILDYEHNYYKFYLGVLYTGKNLIKKIFQWYLNRYFLMLLSRSY